LNLWLMIEAAPGANECSQCLQIQLNALPARSSLTPFLKLLCSRAGCDVTRILGRPLTCYTIKGRINFNFPGRLGREAKTEFCAKASFPARGVGNCDALLEKQVRRLLSLLRRRLFCMPPAAWEAARVRARDTPGSRLFSFSLVRVAVLFMRLWRVKADDAAM
jgi:hypothetical protein